MRVEPPGMRRRRVLALCAGLAFVLAVVSAAGEKGVRRYLKLRSDRIALSDHNAVLRAENRRVRREIRALREDDAAVRRAAREDLGLIGKDEVVFSFE